MVFLAYISHLYTIIKEHNFEVGGFADDHQLLMPFYTNLSSVSNSLHILENCIEAVQSFFLSHNLLINDSKTEFLVVGSKKNHSKINNISLKVGNSNILPSNKVKNFGIIFNKHMVFDKQITYVCRRAYFHLYRINNLRKYLHIDTLKTIIHAFIFNTLDYYIIL